MPEGLIRNTTAAWLLEQALEQEWPGEFEADDSPLSEEEKQMLIEGVADIEAGRYRPVQEALANSLRHGD